MNLAIHYYPIENLVEYERNPRKNDDVVNRMCASIREFGFRIPIVAKSDGTVVDGHLRLKAARKLGMESIPVVLSDNLSEAQTKAFRLLANQSANWAKWDDDLLKLEIQELEDLQFDLKMTGFELEKVQRFLDDIDGKEEVERGEKEGVELVDKKSVVSKPGDLWILGGHRIYCGDSCLVESFKAVLDDKMADITVCDPPYNVAYGDSQEREDKKILNDDQGEKYELFLYDVCTHVLAYTKGAIYICASSSELATLQKLLTLDLGKQTGWAILKDGVIQSGSENFHGSRFSGGGMCFLSFSNWLNSLKDISAVYFEEVRRHLGTDAAHCYGGFFAVLAAWCEGEKIPYKGVPVGTIKRFITGKGNASKSEVIEAVKNKGFIPQDDNEADALALMFYIMSFSECCDINILHNDF
ncbi:hypothetical protein FQR65_LT14972 [Abscondita terminalis]|nr:hypothetical protein FQR65_LT14972 [Abscondita terminalis]